MQRLQPARPSQSLQGATLRQSKPASRRTAVVRAEAPKLLPLLASAAALGVTAVTVRHVLIQRQQQGAPAQQRQRQQRPSSADGPPSSSGSSSTSAPASWAAALASRQAQGLSFGWPLQTKEQKKERQLAGLLQDIEQRQYREEQAAMRHFDARLGLRTKTLAELRAMAQQHNIAGRSKMRKRELVAALEASLGFGPQPQQPQQHRQLH